MKTFFEKGHHVVERRKCLEWVRVRHPSPRGIVFVLPLIGGDLSQQVSQFRGLIQAKYDLFSFNYSGHGSSSDKFSLKATIQDTLYMLSHALGISEQAQLQLYGIASCYSAIPLLHSIHSLGEPFKRLVLINAIPRLSSRALIKSFFAYYRRIFPAQNSMRSLRTAFNDYLDFMFPGIVKGKDYFGSLERKRTLMFRTLAEFFTLNPLKGVRLKTTPVLCLYARNDRILKMYDRQVKDIYENEIRSLCPQTSFHPVDIDHFFSLPWARDEALKSIISFMDVELQGRRNRA
ncbi:MAG: hypothetical protein BBJ57_08895 [Desulfobacterales bacterium PC51MH44]|nr:MAG: hypothetical protein BBJ57_08895 [Desulfobacterales bacterium PC51MH44]